MISCTGFAWAGALLCALGAVASALVAALGTSGLTRGMLIGAALVLLMAGGALLGISIRAARAERSDAGWLPSRDQNL